MYLKAVVMVVVRLGWKAEVEKDEVAQVDVHFLFLVEERDGRKDVSRTPV